MRSTLPEMYCNLCNVCCNVKRSWLTKRVSCLFNEPLIDYYIIQASEQ